jgi:hypothetical protein
MLHYVTAFVKLAVLEKTDRIIRQLHEGMKVGFMMNRFEPNLNSPDKILT